MELEHVAVLYGMRNGIGVQLLFKNGFRGFVSFVLVFTDFLRRVFIKNGRSRKSEKLGIWEELFYRFMIFTKLRTVALIKNEYHAFVAQWFQAFLVVSLVSAI